NNYPSGVAYGVVPSAWANQANTWRRAQQNDPRLSQFDATRQLVTGELFKLVKGGQLGEQELARFEQNLSAANSPEQLRATLSEISTLARGRLEALNTQWQGTMGDAAPPAALNDPKAAALLDKVFAKGHGGAGAQPGGAQQPTAPVAPRGRPVPSSGSQSAAGASVPAANTAQPGEAFGDFVQRGGSPSMKAVRRTGSTTTASCRKPRAA
ncbi:hypothetical protein, partial [Methylocella sp.]|uniref:hypothetical protein n=1 Tax=Methylocella sp. TaxID=1978226 RepID=UPI00378368F6